MSFSGKVVIVTGASSGIGAATAVLFAQEGARVALVGRNEARLAHVAQRCAAHGAQPLVLRADVAVEQEAQTIVEKTVDYFGKLDVLVNNAGSMNFAAVTDPNILEKFDIVIKTDLRAAVQLTNLAAPHLKASKGNIVNVSSMASHRAVKNMIPKCVAKIALDHFTRCAALELAPSGIRVNSVNPGSVRTGLFENSGLVPAGQGDAVWDRAMTMTPLGRVCEPEEIADLIAFLASDKARSITGSSYLSDNGTILDMAKFKGPSNYSR